MQAVLDKSNSVASVCNTCLDRFACMCYHQPDDCPLDDPDGRQESAGTPSIPDRRDIHQQAVEEFTESRFFRGVGYGIAIYLIVAGTTFAVIQITRYWPQIREWFNK